MKTILWLFTTLAIWSLGLNTFASALGGQKNVKLLRTPNGGIQPQAMVDGKGTLHLIYFKGAPQHGDVFYVFSRDGGETYSKPLRVNSVPGSVIAMGNVRGAHLALGKNGRVHVAWMGSKLATPRAPGDETPMIYTRLNDAGTEFEPQRNVIQFATGLDGGGSVAADSSGNVYVAWHAGTPGKQGEEHRQVWVAKSSDQGKTFAKEIAAYDAQTGACGCCGMRAFADSKGKLYVLYRGAKDLSSRDMYLLPSALEGKPSVGVNLHPWKIDHCPMSTEAFAEGKGMVVGAWDTDGQVYFTRIDQGTAKLSQPVAAPGKANKRKHPALAVNASGETLLVWTEGMGWNKGGSLAWCVYDKNGQPTKEQGQVNGVPVWSLVTAVALPDGSFRIFY